MNNFNKYNKIVLNNFLDALKEGREISCQFGSYSSNKTENIMVFSEFCDQTRKYFFEQAIEFSVKNNSIFNYMVTKAYIDNKEILVVSSSGKNFNKETTIEIIKDYRGRISQLNPVIIGRKILPEIEAIEY